MNGMTAFVITLVLAAEVVGLNNRFGTKRTRRFMDEAANRRIDDLGLVQRVSRYGVNHENEQSGEVTVFRCTNGIRLAGAMVCAGAVYLLWQSPELIGASAIGWQMTCVVALFAIWYLAYLFTYRLEIDVDTIRVPTPWFSHRSMPLADLCAVEDDGAYHLRLIFEGERTQTVLKYVTGLDRLHSLLYTHFEHRKPPNARTARGRDRPTRA